MHDINFITLAVTSFIFAVTPGPGIVAVLAVTINRGLKNGVAMSVGEVVGDMIYLIAVMVSIASFAQYMTSALLVIRILGAAYLGWLGYQQLISPPLVVSKDKTSSKSVALSFGAGFMISITNPKVMVFYLSFLPLFIDMTALNLMAGTQVVAVMFFSVLMGPLFVAFLGHRARKLVTDEYSGRMINRLTGLALIAVAIALVVTI